jgi:phage terminase large subunit GpA-like protein
VNRCAEIVRPRLRFTRPPEPAAWAEATLTIPREMSPGSPGRLSFDTRPFARPILNCWHPESGVRKCDAALAVQMVKSTLIAVGTSYRSKYAPLPIMIVGGMSADWAKREISEKRLHPLIRANDELRALMPHNPDKFKLAEMNLAFNSIFVTGAGSDTNLSGSTQGIVVIDEAAKISASGKEESPEAHPIRLAEDRTADYMGQEFIYKCSTPNSPNHIFWQDVLKGTYTHWYVPCPHCGLYFPFEFEAKKGSDLLTAGQLEQTKTDAVTGDYRSVVWSPDARNKDGTWNEEKIRETAHYVCPHNGCRIVDMDKPKMVRAGEETHLNPNAPMSHRSFRVNSFYNLKRTFGEMALKFLGRGDLFNTGLQAFYNHHLTLPWEEIDVKLKDEDILSCKTEGDIAYVRGTVPGVEGVLFAGADWGQTMTHWVVALVDRAENIWVVDWGTVLSERDLLAKKEEWSYARASKPGVKMRPRVGFVDSSDHTEQIYQMCRDSGGFWWPTKGSDASSGVLNVQDLKRYIGVQLITFVDKIAKDDLYDRRVRQKKGSRLFLPSDTTDDLIDGLRGQERVDRGLLARWKKVLRDHYGDAIKNILILVWYFAAGRKRED